MYDNIAEAPDELAFRKDDILTVLEQNTAGLEGWWLCSLRGRQVYSQSHQCFSFNNQNICLGNLPWKSFKTDTRCI